jgi:hypothetical protein
MPALTPSGSNHEAALYLKVEKGHFNKAFTKSLGAGSKLRIDRSVYKIEISIASLTFALSSENVPIEGFEIAYRMKFTQSAIEGHDSRIGHGKGYTIQLMILDFESKRCSTLIQDHTLTVERVC